MSEVKDGKPAVAPHRDHPLLKGNPVDGGTPSEVVGSAGAGDPACRGDQPASRSQEQRETYERLLQEAYDRYCAKPDWSVFYREVLGVDGLLRRTLSRHEDLVQFEKSEFFREIQFLLRRLRETCPPEEAEVEPIQVITIRIPESLQQTLRQEAFDQGTSMNKLCISKLLQRIEEEAVPSEVVYQSSVREARKGRRRRKSDHTTPEDGDE